MKIATQGVKRGSDKDISTTDYADSTDGTKTGPVRHLRHPRNPRLNSVAKKRKRTELAFRPFVKLFSANAYFNFARTSFTALKFGRSFTVGVCSAYWMTPFLSTTNAARALTAPKPARSSSNTP